MGEMVIAAYRPKAGCENELLKLVRGHVPYLRDLGFATSRPALAMQSKNGTIVEVFEWEAGAAEKAHKHAGVMELWSQYAEVCDFIPLAYLPEANEIFAHYQPIDL